MTVRDLRRALAPVAVLTGGFLLVSNASASIMGGLFTGSSGNITVSLSSAIFNTDSAAIGGGNSDVSTGTTLTFAGCASGVLGSAGCLSQQEGVTINNADLTLSAPSAANANTFLTFASHPNLVFSINWPPGPGSLNTNCAATTGNNGASCSVFAGSPIILTYSNGDTFVGLSVSNASNPAKVSDTGVAGLATSNSTYTGGFSEFLTATLPNGMAPTPQNIQNYFCPDFVTNGNACSAADFNSGRSITSSQSGTFNANFNNVPEPSPLFLSSIGILLLLVGTRVRKSQRTRA
jgi:hypothetical protein